MEPIEVKLARLIRGGGSILLTDAYKFSMGQAGFPLREETFHLTLRRGGPFYAPFDLAEVVREFAKIPVVDEDLDYLKDSGFGLTPAMREALQGELRIEAAPKGSWVLAGEPIVSITGPSFLVSWLEPLVLMLHYPIQLATAAMNGTIGSVPTTCSDEREIIEVVASVINRKIETVENDAAYFERVFRAASAVVDALGGEGARAFEVGLRAATCVQQHMAALEACRNAGITRTSNVFGAYMKDLEPVGSTGHEHQQRWGVYGGDEPGFRAIRDMRPQPPSYLFDALDPIRVGIPAAVKVMREDPSRACAVRFDSGDQEEQLRLFLAHEEIDGIRPTYIFEDGYTAEKTRRNEELCDALGVERERRLYGYGGFLVSGPTGSPYNRDAVSAAYKLAATGGRAVMKFSGSPGKRSIPGDPVVLRRVADGIGPEGVIAQRGEVVPGYAPIDPADTRQASTSAGRATTSLSPATRALIETLEADLAALKATHGNGNR